VRIARGDVWWADLDEPSGSEPGLRRPVVVVQSDSLNESRLATVICVPLTSSQSQARAPGNVVLPRSATQLPLDSVANVSQIVTLDRSELDERVGRVPPRLLDLILAGLDVVLGR